MLARVILAFIAAWLVSLATMPLLIKELHKLNFGQSVRLDGPQSHLKKNGTPTMGGVGFFFSTILVSLIFCYGNYNFEYFICIFAFIGYGMIGFIDDYLIVIKKDNEGLRPKYKMALQAILAIIFYLLYTRYESSAITIPFTKIILNLGPFYFLFILIMFVGETNGVNFADGMDGLCASLMMVALIPYIIFAYKLQKYNLAITLSSLIGGLLGYFHYNKHPAKVFMGDTGSLALGGILAASAMITKQELSLLIVGFIFLVEVLSVIIQVTYFKATGGKRFFRMAPIHHHFELGGMKETSVVKMFVLVGALCSAIGIVMGVLL